MSSYQRSIAGDFTGEVNFEQLQQEIEDDVIITKTLRGMKSNDDVLLIYFLSALTTAEETQLDVLIAAHSPIVISGDAGVYGCEYQYVASDAESTTTLTTLQTKLTLTTPSIPAGDYRLGYCLEYSNAANGVLTEVEVKFDGVVVALPTMESDNDYLTVSGFVIQTLASGVRVATIKHRVQTTGTSKVRRARLELFRVA